jgi:hypothetical protein
VLQPWSALEDPATRAFSGTATYACTVNLESIRPDSRFSLDLGRVSAIAEVAINGKPVPTLWGAPYRTDITDYVATGANRVEIRVTNTWFNRLVYDADQPREKQRTWAINPPAKNTPLELAGLAGPVVIRIGTVAALPGASP